MRRSRMLSPLLLPLLASLSFTIGFAPAAVPRHATPMQRNVVLSMADESTATSFDDYQLGQSTLVYKDDVVGEGDDTCQTGDVITVSFAGRLYPSGYQFATNDDFVFELGEGKTMPGFDTALVGTKVGCKRTIRVPPSLAFGARGNAPKIPPNADLEFDVEIKSIARGAIAGNVAKIGVGRLLGFIACFAVLAITPLLS